MITAKEAREISSIESRAKRFIEDIDKEIREAASNGEYKIIYVLPYDEELIKHIAVELVRNDYVLTSNNNSNMYKLAISWKERNIYDKTLDDMFKF